MKHATKPNRAARADSPAAKAHPVLMRFTTIVLVVSILVFLYGAYYRVTAARRAAAPNYPPLGRMPPGFATDTGREANAFRYVCSQCHVLPSPYMFDADGWLGVVEKMGGQMKERGVEFSKREIDQAVAYVTRNAAPKRSLPVSARLRRHDRLPPMPDLNGVEPPVVEAIKTARARLAANLRSAEAWGEMGMTYHAHGMFDDANQCYGAAEALAPKDFRWPHLIGTVMEDTIEVENTVRAFERAVELNPKDVVALCQLGALAVEAGDDAAGARHFLKAIEADPRCVTAMLGIAEALHRTGQDDAAIECLKGALRVAVNCGPAHSALARIYGTRSGDAERAAVHARWAAFLPQEVSLDDPVMIPVKQRGVSFRARVGRGQHLLSIGKPAEAIKELRAAVAMRPDDADAHYKLGSALGAAHRFDEGRAELARAIKLQPKLTAAHLAAARMYLAERNHVEALDAVERGIEVEPDSADAHYLKGQVLQAQGKDAEALASYDRALSLWPYDAQAHMSRGEILLGRHQPAEALEAFRAAVDRRPDIEFGFNGLGAALMELSRFSEAASAFERAAAVNPASPTARINLIVALKAAGRNEDAEKALTGARSRWPDHPLIKRLIDGERTPIRLGNAR